MAAENHSVQLACRVLGVSESGYYARKSRAPSPRAIRHTWLTDIIREIHRDSRGVYGARRVHAELTLGRGVPVGHCAVQMLMARAGIAGITGRPRYRKIPNEATASDRVVRDFSRDEPDQLWVTDITEHPTREGKVYCAVVLDAYSRKVVGMAIDNRNPSDQTVIHSDQGTQGGFDWSSQHHDRGGVVDDHEGAAAGGADLSRADSLSRPTHGGVATRQGQVLGGDRRRRHDGRGGARDRRVIRGRDTVVPTRWRSEPQPRPFSFRPLPVFLRAGRHRDLARPEAGCARDSPPPGPLAFDDLTRVAPQCVHPNVAA